jgi:hypothetical protein
VSVTLDNPGAVLAKLEQIDADLAQRQNEIEAAAEAWFTAKREKERDWAEAYVTATGPVPARKAYADRATWNVGLECEARYEALKAVVRVLETRASINQSLLKSQERASFRRNG